MTIRILIAIALLAGIPVGTLAQSPTPEQRTACNGDYNRYCKGTMPGGGRIIACLNKHRDSLSPACRKTLDTQK